MQTNLYANSGLLVTDPNKFIDFHCINKLLLASYNYKIYFYWKESFLKKRLTGGYWSITKQYTSNLFPLFISIQNVKNVHSYHLKTKCFNIWRDLNCVFESSRSKNLTCQPVICLMYLKLSKSSYWNASFYNLVLLWSKYIPKPT